MAHHASPQAHEDEEDEMLQALMAMDSRGRVRAFRNHFMGTVEPLHMLKQPAQRESYPAHFTNDIIGAYLKFTTFAVPVRINYDAACKKFYTDRRAQDCGKLVLTPKAERHLTGTIGDARLQLRRVCFQISTPFQLLYNVVVRVVEMEDGGKEIRARWQKVTNEEHAQLDNFIADVCVGMEEGCTLPDDCEGLMLTDIRQVARVFARQPTKLELEIKRSLFQEHMSAWMDLEEDYNNEGWTDFEALGKPCTPLQLSHCAGCHSGIRRLPAMRFTATY